MTVKTRRVEFNNILEDLLGIPDNVYFQPPPNVVMNYPAIVYNRDNADRKSADNIAYKFMPRYQVTLISKDPDEDAYDKLVALPYSSFNRHFATSGLNHDVFTIYY